MEKDCEKKYYYISPDETRWKTIAGLINLIYESIECSSHNTAGERQEKIL